MAPSTLRRQRRRRRAGKPYALRDISLRWTRERVAKARTFVVPLAARQIATSSWALALILKSGRTINPDAFLPNVAYRHRACPGGCPQCKGSLLECPARGCLLP
jgi:hypothetical protein